MQRFTRDKIILAAALIITVGALVSRSHAQPGFWISFAGLAGLLLSGLPAAVGDARRYRSLVPLSRTWVALQGITLILLVNFAISHRMLYFPVLLVLAAEYFIYDSQRRGQDK